MWSHIVVGLVMLVAILVGCKWIVRLIGCPCQFCNNLKMTPFDELESETQRKVMIYFRDHERREPDTTGIWVCRQCGTVFDDFSGEKASRAVDPYGCMTWCKVCNALMRGCDLHNDNILCRRCGTKYAWKEHKESGLKFLVPPEGAAVLDRCDDGGSVA